jgi:hypothetical protein
MTQTDEVPSSVKDLWCETTSRIHTAYGRLSSLITFPEVSSCETKDMDLMTLAELGLISTNDKYGKLSHFQEFKTELENIF